MNAKRTALSVTVAVAAGIAAGQVMARDHIKIVGSSTVYPYAQAVSEEFANKTGKKAPVLESTGSGGGMKIFCKGVGDAHPDITNASRAMKQKEWELCNKNGVTKITEVNIGFDGLSVALSRKGTDFDVTKMQLYKALAKQVPVDGKLVDNPYKKWSDIDKALPNQEILVYGPPPTSGTRDAFVELVFHKSCKKAGGYWAAQKKAMDKKAFKKHYKAKCSAMRTDGQFVEAGENDNLIVQRLEADTKALGIFGYSFLFENQDKLKAVKIKGVSPSMETIADGSYGISRPLFFYIKNAHRNVTSGLNEYIAEFLSEGAMGEDGYLIERGLVALPEDALQKVRMDAEKGNGMTRFTK